MSCSSWCMTNSLLTGTIDDEHPRTDVACHEFLRVLEQMCHVNEGVVDRRVGTGRLGKAGVDNRPTLSVEADLPLDKQTNKSPNRQ